MRVLIADDDLVSRLAMEDVLQQCGRYDVTTVADGAAAWAVLDSPACFDLLCLDVRMPAPDGLELLAMLRARVALRRVPVLMITSTADRAIVAAATSAGSGLQGFLVKPVGGETVTRIARVLAQLDASILEPGETATRRLHIDAERHARYVAAFAQQIQMLEALARGLAQPAAGTPATAASTASTAQTHDAFVRKAEACRTAALTLGSPRIEQLVADALEAVQVPSPDAAGAEGAMRQAAYWLARVTAPS